MLAEVPNSWAPHGTGGSGLQHFVNNQKEKTKKALKTKYRIVTLGDASRYLPASAAPQFPDRASRYRTSG